MPALAEFKEALCEQDADAIIERFLLTPGAAHVSDENINYIQSAVAASFGADRAGVQAIITGSAKLGFSLVQKRKKDSPPRPRYRVYDAESDIDVAIINPVIFDQLWSELSGHAHRASRFPPPAGRLGDYLVCGWLRPDHFPKGVRLPRCDAWADTFRRLSANSRFSRRRVNGGIFATLDHLKQYMSRAVSECISEEAST